MWYVNQSLTIAVFITIVFSSSLGFSRQAIALLKDLKAEFGTFDIFTDEKVREDLKKYSNWPTYPQVWINTKENMLVFDNDL